LYDITGFYLVEVLYDQLVIALSLRIIFCWPSSFRCMVFREWRNPRLAQARSKLRYSYERRPALLAMLAVV